MSEVIGRWIIVAQDAMPPALRNSVRWKSLLPLAAGTGREQEQARLKIILDWMWGTVLPSLQPLADQQGFGAQWQKMTTERTFEASKAAAEAAAGAATWTSKAAARAAARAARAARSAGVWTWAATWAARTAAEAAEVARAEAWSNFDPCELLERLIRIGNNTQGVA
jgi:hypothetical protein